VTIKFHIIVETQGAVAVGSSAVLGQLASNLKHRSANRSAPLRNKNAAAAARRARSGASRESLQLVKLCRIKTEKSKSLAAHESSAKSRRSKSETENPSRSASPANNSVKPETQRVA
jgi:hypothetical protein